MGDITRQYLPRPALHATRTGRRSSPTGQTPPTQAGKRWGKRSSNASLNRFAFILRLNKFSQKLDQTFCIKQKDKK